MRKLKMKWFIMQSLLLTVILTSCGQYKVLQGKGYLWMSENYYNIHAVGIVKYVDPSGKEKLANDMNGYGFYVNNTSGRPKAYSQTIMYSKNGIVTVQELKEIQINEVSKDKCIIQWNMGENKIWVIGLSKDYSEKVYINEFINNQLANRFYLDNNVNE